MGAETSATYAELLKEAWPQDDIYEEVCRQGGLLPILPKDTDFYEEYRHIIVGYGTGQGVGAGFGGAKAAKSADSQAEFKIPLRTYYSMFSIDRLLRKRSQKKRGAILPALDRKAKNALIAWRRDMAHLLYGTGVGDIGRVLSFTGSTITLATATDIRKFERYMQIESSTDNTGVAGVKAGVGTIASVVRSATTSTITLTGTVASQMPNLANNDYLYRSSNYNAVVIGLAKQLPATAPTAGDNLYSLDRSVDAQRLAGVLTDATGLSPRESALLSAKDVDDAGPGMPDTYVISSTDYYNLQLELQSAGAMITTKVTAAPIGDYNFGIEYDAIQFMGPRGKIKAIADADSPIGVGWMLELDTWKLASCGELVAWDDDGGGRDHREENSDTYEYRAAGDLAFYCEAPGNNGRVTLG